MPSSSSSSSFAKAHLAGSGRVFPSSLLLSHIQRAWPRYIFFPLSSSSSSSVPRPCESLQQAREECNDLERRRGGGGGVLGKRAKRAKPLSSSSFSGADVHFKRATLFYWFHASAWNCTPQLLLHLSSPTPRCVERKICGFAFVSHSPHFFFRYANMELYCANMI